jgi:hypothetical protein
MIIGEDDQDIRALWRLTLIGGAWGGAYRHE